MSKLLAAIAGVTLLTPAAMAGPLLPSGPLSAIPAFAQVSDHSVAYKVQGNGRPVIVLITGLGDNMSVFGPAARNMSRWATVITYDRPGYGSSTLASRDSGANAAADDLSGVLQQSGVRSPYVIVGHSLGGLIAEQFAALHPDKVAGLVLVESRPAAFGHKCEAAGIKACAPTLQMVRGASAGAQHDVAGLEARVREVAAIRPASSLRVLVISRRLATQPTPFETVWSQAQIELAHSYPGAIQRIAPTSRHDVHRAAVDWLCASILNFVQEGAVE